jgi:hypothetical protein
MRKLFLFILVILTLTSCVTFHNGNVSSSSYDLEENVRAVGLAYGISSYYTILGMNGHRKDAMIMDAKRNMYEAFPLQPGQAYANYTLDIKSTVFFVGRTVKVTVSADIVEKGVDKISPTKVSEKINSFYGSESLKVGEKILFSGSGYLSQEAVILKVKRNGAVKIGVLNFEGNFQLKTINNSDALSFRECYMQKHNISYSAKKVTKEEAIVEKPFELKVPEDAKGKIVTFIYKGKVWQGELLKEMYEGFMIRAADQYGNIKGYVIPKKDMITEDK